MDTIITLIVIPLVVGIVVAIFQWLLPPRDKVKVTNWIKVLIRFTTPKRSKTFRSSKGGEATVDASKFIRDVTIPDGSYIKVGEEFEKIWEIQNVGTIVWENRFLKREGACEGVGLITSPEKVPIPTTYPDQTVQIKVPMKAPTLPRTTTCIWKMVDEHGVKCFSNKYKYGLSITINVIE